MFCFEGEKFTHREIRRHYVTQPQACENHDNSVFYHLEVPRNKYKEKHCF